MHALAIMHCMVCSMNPNMNVQTLQRTHRILLFIFVPVFGLMNEMGQSSRIIRFVGEKKNTFWDER